MSNLPHKIWKRLSQKTVYKGRVHIVEHEVELPNGEITKYEVDHSDSCAVAVLIKTHDDHIILTHQFRFPLNRWIYDLPGGSKHKNETIEEAAIRECREEIGIAPAKIVKLGMFYPNPARTDWPAYVFFCDEFKGDAHLDFNDSSEIIKRVKMPIAEFKELINDQEIVDPMLLIAWFTACSRGFIRF